MIQRVSLRYGLALVAGLFQAHALGQQCTQSTDPVNISPTTFGCFTQNPAPTPNYHGELRYFRRYRPGTDCGMASGMTVGGVSFGVNAAVGGNSVGSQPIEVRLYTIPAASQLVLANMTLVRTEMIQLTDGNNYFETVQFAVPLTVGAGVDIVPEIYAPNGIPGQNFFLIGQNGAGETADSYYASASCGTLEPTPFSMIGTGFGNNHLLVHLEPPGPTVNIGTNYCSPNIANTTGQPGVISATGSAVVADNDVTLVAAQLPPNQFGIFTTSLTQGFVPAPGGSQGNLCLGGQIGRYNAAGQILNSGPGGSFFLQINLATTPTPTGPVPVLPGQTRNYQAWYRDLIPGQGAVSNFTNALSITFQ